MEVSVILPCFNGAATIGVQLEALARQQWSGTWEVVVVNNGSTDASMDIVRSFQGRVPHLRIVEAHRPGEKRLGVDHSYRRGLAAAKGDAFLFCEADDEVADDWLPILAEALREHAFVAASLDYGKLNPSDLADPWAMQTRSGGLLRTVAPLRLPASIGCAIGFRRTVYERIGGPAPDCGPSWDIDFSWRAQLSGFPLTFVPAAVVHYRMRDGAGARYKQANAWGESQARVLVKYADPIDFLTVMKYNRQVLRITSGLAVQLAAVAIGRLSLNYWIWELGWLVGHVRGAFHVFKSFASRLGRSKLAGATL